MAFLNGVYAVVLLGGGVMGYLKRGSTASLISSSIFALLYAVSAYLIASGMPARGHQLSLVSSVVLAVVMGVRFLRTMKVMPAGMLAAMAALMILRNLVTVNGMAGIRSRF